MHHPVPAQPETTETQSLCHRIVPDVNPEWVNSTLQPDAEEKSVSLMWCRLLQVKGKMQYLAGLFGTFLAFILRQNFIASGKMKLETCGT